MNNVGSVKTDENMINNVSEKLHNLIENVAINVTTINQTLTSRIDWFTADQKTNRVKINYNLILILSVLINIYCNKYFRNLKRFMVVSYLYFVLKKKNVYVFLPLIFLKY